ncbi:MAG: 4-hydroxy-tetrahydrodipicolinate reductase, partial [Candidatus Rokuibacteriota bacterium]
MAVRIAVAGGLGRMGSEIVALALSRPDEFAVEAVGVEQSDPRAGNSLGDVFPVKGNAAVLAEKQLKEALRAKKFDVLLDVTGPESGVGFMRASIDARVPFVSGSTGIKPKALDDLAAVAKKAGVAGVWTPNFSVGVNVWWSLIAKAAKGLPGYDVEVVEVHHNQKKDA